VTLTSLQAIDAEIRQLEAQKALLETRDTEVPQALVVLQKFAALLTHAQRQQIARLIQAEPAAAGRARGAGTGGKRGPVAPKYALPTGELWTGRGRTPTAFVAWEKSADGKAWQKANEGQRFPPAPGSEAASAEQAPSPRARKKQQAAAPRGRKKRARARG